MDCWVPVPQPPDRQPMPDSLPHAAATDRGAIQQLEEQLGREGFARLLATFLEGAPGRLAELRTAADAGDAARVREHAHSLKGAARSFGAAEVGELALRLEQESAAGSLAGAHGLIAALETSLARTQAEFRSQLGPRGGEQPRSIRVLLADDDPVVRGLIATLLEAEPAMELVGAAEDADAAIDLAVRSHPDVALLDLDMPGGGGWRAIEEIRDRSPETQSIVLTALDTPEEQLHTMRSGAVDFLSKGASKADIVDAIRSAMRWRPESQGGDEPESAPTSPETRIADLEQRVGSLEQTLVGLLSKLG
jgi:DNA-binding NarL/FixJ family response regulator